MRKKFSRVLKNSCNIDVPLTCSANGIIDVCKPCNQSQHSSLSTDIEGDQEAEKDRKGVAIPLLMRNKLPVKGGDFGDEKFDVSLLPDVVCKSVLVVSGVRSHTHASTHA